MIRTLLAIVRDITLFCILVMLVQIAFKDTKSYIAEHKESIIHELDRTFIDQLYTVQRQLHILEEHPVIADTYAVTISDLKNKLSTIEEQYKKNSPGLALLGPIGTAAIVTKEEQLVKKLLVVVNEIGKILHAASQDSIEFKPLSTIHAGLKINKKRIKHIIT